MTIFGKITNTSRRQRTFLCALNAALALRPYIRISNDDVIEMVEDDRLSLGIDIVDRQSNVVITVPRIDHYENKVVVGYDYDSQMSVHISETIDNTLIGSQLSESEMAEYALNWIDKGLRRNVERREWIMPNYTHKKWFYTDTNEEILWSDSQNVKRDELGNPTQVIPINSNPR